MSSGSLLPRILFWLFCAAALALVGLVIGAPATESSSRVLRLFAEDATVRRTALASALGLLVTACVFFRRPGESSDDNSRSGSGQAPPPDAVGA